MGAALTAWSIALFCLTAIAAQVALQIVLTGLKQFNPVYIVFHGKGNKTRALETIQTAVLYTELLHS